LGLNLTLLGEPQLLESPLLQFPSDNWAKEIGFSPNGQWFAYGTGFPPSGFPNTIYLFSAQGEIIRQIPPGILPNPMDPQAGGWTSTRWLNDELMLISIFNGTKEYREFFLALLDPFTGVWHQSFLDNLPDRYDQAAVQFSPDLTRVMYVREPDEEFRYSLVLWSLETKTELWRREGFQNNAMIRGAQGGDTDTLAWSRDSLLIAFVDWVPTSGGGEGQLYVIDRNGKNLKILNSSLQLGNGTYGLSWSPNGHYLAAVSPLAKDPMKRGIVIYDVETNNAIDMCPLAEDDNPVNRTGNGRIIWSPNGQYLAYGTGWDPLSDSDGIVLLDVYSGEIFLLKQGARVMLSASLTS